VQEYANCTYIYPKPTTIMSRLLLAIFFFAIACNSKPQPNTLSSQEKEQGWTLLFDGKTLNGWHLYNKGNGPSSWKVVNNEIYCDPVDKSENSDLVTDKEFENYELQLEWKISEKGNSGIFINVQERPELATAWASGPEYQILEETHHDFPNEKKRAGCLYNFYPQLNTAKLHPLNEWNQTRIVQNDGKVEFYLNGILTCKEDFNSQAWKDTIAKTHFKEFPEFGKYTKGRIALQDWAKGVYFRNIKIREL
jgi:hypothetical protein